MVIFAGWQRKGKWQQTHDQLRSQLRERQGRKANSTVASADSQSVKTTEKRTNVTADNLTSHYIKSKPHPFHLQEYERLQNELAIVSQNSHLPETLLSGACRT